eukprot:6189270-Pleurochrysis_carterae.AAC.3
MIVYNQGHFLLQDITLDHCEQKRCEYSSFQHLAHRNLALFFNFTTKRSFDGFGSGSRKTSRVCRTNLSSSQTATHSRSYHAAHALPTFGQRLDTSILRLTLC